MSKQKPSDSSRKFSTWQGLSAFVDQVLRGMGQVMFQDNPYTGLLFLLGILIHSPLWAAAALLGTGVSTVTARALGVAPSAVCSGLYGYNGALVAIALLYFLQPSGLTWAYVGLAGFAATLLTAAMTRLLQPWNLPVLTAPFVVTTLVFVLALARFGHLHATDHLPIAALPGTVAVEGIVGPETLTYGLLNGIAQIFFQENGLTGAMFLLGLLLASPRATGMAVLGSLVGLLMAWGMGGSETAMRSGAYGFNGALTTLALGSVFLQPGKAAFLHALLAALLATLLFASLSAAFAPFGMPALTLPFVLTVWLYLLASPETAGIVRKG